MRFRRHSWIGIDDPHRHDHARVRLSTEGLTAHGSSTTDQYATSWSLEVGPGWITRALHVDVRAESWSRALDLVRDADGRWSASSHSEGDADLPEPGLLPGVDLDGAVDCDLGLCPLTNVMPIRRLGLLDAAVEDTALVMAWVDVPSLQVRRSGQVYGSTAPGHVRYTSLSRNVSVDLDVDEDGVVLEYPGLARPVSL